jgi:diaminopimelate epimerase
VLVGPAARELDLVGFGSRMQQAYAGGINVEVAEPLSASELEMSVFERGAGLTMACGSGTCAVAAVARGWGLAGDEVVVRNPGGDLRVSLSGGGPEVAAAVLTVPVRRVAEVTVDLADLDPGSGPITATPLVTARS